MGEIPTGPWAYVRHPETCKAILTSAANGREVLPAHAIACRDALTAAEARIRELEAQADMLREMTVRLGEDVMAFGDDDAPPTRSEFLLVVREVHSLRATVAALMPGDAGHVG